MAKSCLLLSYDLIKKCKFPQKMTWIISKYGVTRLLEIQFFLYFFIFVTLINLVKSYFDNLTPWIAFLMSFVLYCTVLYVLQYCDLYCIMCTAIL